MTKSGREIGGAMMRARAVVQFWPVLGLVAAFACDPTLDGPADGASGGTNSGSGSTNSGSGGAALSSGGHAATGSGSHSSGGSGDGVGGEGGHPELGGEGNAAGGSESASGGRFSGLGGSFFESGARAVIPAIEQEVRMLVTPDLAVMPSAMDINAFQTSLLDAPGLSREHKLSILMPYLFDADRCTGPLYGALEIDQVEVIEDLDQTGAQLSIESGVDYYTLRHEGLGRHQVNVTGSFVPAVALECQGIFNEDGKLPLAFHREVIVQEASGVQFAFPEACSQRPLALSGTALVTSSPFLLDSKGQVFYADNVTSSSSIDITIETERAAEIRPAAGLAYPGVVVTGTAQLVRLSTRFGTLAIYELVEAAQVEAWDVKFWVNGGHGVSPQPIESGGTYQGGVIDAAEIGADIQLLIEGDRLCSLLPVDKFTVVSRTPDECAGPEGGAPYLDPLVRLTDYYGTCALDLGFPSANGGDGLGASLSATFADLP